jgi:hypothetical protein
MIHHHCRKVQLKYVLALFLPILFLTPSVLGVSSSFKSSIPADDTPVSQVSTEIEIPPGSEYVVRFDAQNMTLKGEDIVPSTEGLSQNVIAAIAKSPTWIQQRLTSQFQTLSNPESYADVLLNASMQYADEIAFSIACCPTWRVPAAMLLKENAESIYEHDTWIQYAQIVDYDDGMGNYYSTIQYAVLENGAPQEILLPPDIYYWYIVHPIITTEDVDAVYGPLWRDYLFLHNDIGYPLLKEKLSTIQYLWDCESYDQPGGRLWSVCISQHPTAIEAVSYWIGKTAPYPAVGDRPGQASVIAHEHNGWCGELQKIAIAAQRAALIPSIGACNVGEDHVWREFYERGWHENDNWWSDTGGAVDKPDVYAYGWGKNMSAIYQWRGDGMILQDTARYIHPEDRITVQFDVKDSFLQPVDGARVIVLVKGPKDITYYKNLIWEKIQGVWDRLPDLLKGKLLSFLFDRIKQRFDQIPDSINGETITTWNYTDSEGQCSITLGKNLDYLFLIQAGNLKKPWQLAHHNVFRSLKTGVDREFHIILFDVSQKPQRKTVQQMPSGECWFNLSFSSTAYQLQKHFINDGIGRFETAGCVECFFVDEQNYQQYLQGTRYTCYDFLSGENASESVSAGLHDWFIVFRNPMRDTTVLLTCSVEASVSTSTDHVQIVSPDTTLFETPVYPCGDTVLISGVATSDTVFLDFDHESPDIELVVVNGEWSYPWDTSFISLGSHVVTVSSPESTSDEEMIRIIDGHPPSLSIDTPGDGDIVEQGVLAISGQCSDNVGVDHVEVTLDNSTKQASGTYNWNLSWDTSGLSLGDHLLVVRAVDTQGLVAVQTRCVVLNESGQSWGPQINDLYNVPVNCTNISNVIVYANVTTTGPFAVKDVMLFLDDGSDTTSSEMYRYGDFPIQGRHEEDPLANQSNGPLFGIELGQFSSGQTLMYWVVARDTAHNTRQSEVAWFTIQ